MKNYSIVRIGDGYVVQADEKSILKIASRRRAAKLVTRAAELLGSPPHEQVPPETHAELSNACEPAIIPDPSEVP